VTPPPLLRCHAYCTLSDTVTCSVAAAGSSHSSRMASWSGSDCTMSRFTTGEALYGRRGRGTREERHGSQAHSEGPRLPIESCKCRKWATTGVLPARSQPQPRPPIARTASQPHAPELSLIVRLVAVGDVHGAQRALSDHARLLQQQPHHPAFGMGMKGEEREVSRVFWSRPLPIEPELYPKCAAGRGGAGTHPSSSRYVMVTLVTANVAAP
jgi:hypothetical protein